MQRETLAYDPDRKVRNSLFAFLTDVVFSKDRERTLLVDSTLGLSGSWLGRRGGGMAMRVNVAPPRCMYM